MKLSISLPDADVAALDEYLRTSGLSSRSAAVHEAVRLLTREPLQDDYAAAFDEWDSSGEREAWEGVTGEGIR